MNSQSKLLERITDLEREVKLLTLEIRRIRLENKKQLAVAIAEQLRLISLLTQRKEEKIKYEMKIETKQAMNNLGIGMGWFFVFIGITMIGFKLFTNEYDAFEYVYLKALAYIILGWFNKEIFTYSFKKNIETQIKDNLTKQNNLDIKE